jgi:hypothetical protein
MIFKWKFLSKGKGLSIEYFVLKGLCHEERCFLPTGKCYLTVVMNTPLFVGTSVAI